MRTRSLLKRAEKIAKRKGPIEPIKITRQIVESNGDITAEIVDGKTIELTKPFESIHGRKTEGNYP